MQGPWFTYLTPWFGELRQDLIRQVFQSRREIAASPTWGVELPPGPGARAWPTRNPVSHESVSDGRPNHSTLFVRMIDGEQVHLEPSGIRIGLARGLEIAVQQVMLERSWDTLVPPPASSPTLCTHGRYRTYSQEAVPRDHGAVRCRGSAPATRPAAPTSRRAQSPRLDEPSFVPSDPRS